MCRLDNLFQPEFDMLYPLQVVLKHEHKKMPNLPGENIEDVNVSQFKVAHCECKAFKIFIPDSDLILDDDDQIIDDTGNMLPNNEPCFVVYPLLMHDKSR